MLNSCQGVYWNKFDVLKHRKERASCIEKPKEEKLNLHLFLYDVNASEAWKNQKKHRKSGLNVPGAANLMIIQQVLVVRVDLNDRPLYDQDVLEAW